jgi:hypothetical protein
MNCSTGRISRIVNQYGDCRGDAQNYSQAETVRFGFFGQNLANLRQVLSMSSRFYKIETQRPSNRHK